jgi:hypothetical protein
VAFRASKPAAISKPRQAQDVSFVGDLSAKWTPLLAARIEEAIRKGTPLKDIHQHTRFFKNAGGELSREISDQDVKVNHTLLQNMQPGQLMTFKGLAEAPELLKHYPEIEQMNVGPDANPNRSGVFFEALNEINLNPNLPEDEIRRTLIHELQHKIQSIQGWIPGSSPSLFRVPELLNTPGSPQEKIMKLWKSAWKLGSDVSKWKPYEISNTGELIYGSGVGEQMAELAAKRGHMDTTTLKANDPYKVSMVPPEHQNDPRQVLKDMENEVLKMLNQPGASMDFRKRAPWIEPFITSLGSPPYPKPKVTQAPSGTPRQALMPFLFQFRPQMVRPTEEDFGTGGEGNYDGGISQDQWLHEMRKLGPLPRGSRY